MVARRKEKLKELASELEKSYHTIDILVNNAGFATKGLLSNTDFEKQHQKLMVNMVALPRALLMSIRIKAFG